MRCFVPASSRTSADRDLRTEASARRRDRRSILTQGELRVGALLFEGTDHKLNRGAFGVVTGLEHAPEEFEVDVAIACGRGTLAESPEQASYPLRFLCCEPRPECTDRGRRSAGPYAELVDVLVVLVMA